MSGKFREWHFTNFLLIRTQELVLKIRICPKSLNGFEKITSRPAIAHLADQYSVVGGIGLLVPVTPKPGYIPGSARAYGLAAGGQWGARLL